MNNLNELEKFDHYIEEHLNYSKANWSSFKEQLDLIDTSEITKSNDANQINYFFY